MHSVSILNGSLVPGPFQGVGMSRVVYVWGWVCPGVGITGGGYPFHWSAFLFKLSSMSHYLFTVYKCTLTPVTVK